ncbi:AIPR family protein [Flavobacterium terrae]|uniref:AIPR protein n=1 Tax=Flavobacterium terrae TaxID=415425 RepID=A0A1M6HGX4_9FLAO|nr:AIPR family protein [Flavobacterium terrae]SHJ21442.1 AIPR protein [Flavobacterium terrae]
MTKYSDLLKIVDSLRLEAPLNYNRYHPEKDEKEKLENARGRAFIHLYLKVTFGLIDFNERENYITDDGYDGGIDAYFIDQENKKLYFIQSKFRNSDQNFENKEITFEELLSMDIERIVEGEEEGENGIRYNGKIQNLIKHLQSISDLPKYKYEIILLANVKNSLQPKLNKLTGGYPVHIFNFQRIYSELVFPLVSGSYYNISELKITINVDRNSAGHRIQYYPVTKYAECTVNALFVPTIEIAKILSKYKNSILKFNPRSYLDLATGSINEKISRSITDFNTNEFALFNNGITMLSDDTVYSDKVGKKNKAEVLVTNPQIINGGQTAYTLSILYDRFLKNDTLHLFENKEVLLKIISFNVEEHETKDFEENKLKLIEQISIATNQQSPVFEADRRANDKVQIDLQRSIYDDFGLYYERKRGEFGDGIRSGYVDRSKIIDRENFIRICLASQNNPVQARAGSVANFFNKQAFDSILPDASEFRKYIFCLKGFERIAHFSSDSSNVRFNARYAITTVLSNRFENSYEISDYDNLIDSKLKDIIGNWPSFEDFLRQTEENKRYYFKEKFDIETGEKYIETNWTAYYKGRTLLSDLKNYFNF